MDETLTGYARCSTDEQDLTAQRQALVALGVAADRVYIDHGISGTKRERPGLDQALAAVRTGDTLVVPKLDRLARSVPDARDIGDTLAQRGVRLSLGGQIYDPDDPMGKMFFNILATFAEFEVDLIRMRTREGMAVARAQGKLKGRQPKLSSKQQRNWRGARGFGEWLRQPEFSGAPFEELIDAVPHDGEERCRQDPQRSDRSNEACTTLFPPQQ